MAPLGTTTYWEQRDPLCSALPIAEQAHLAGQGETGTLSCPIYQTFAAHFVDMLCTSLTAKPFQVFQEQQVALLIHQRDKQHVQLCYICTPIA